MEKTIIRENLMNQKDYTPYCGDELCKYHMPRVKWNKGRDQFICSCGWVSSIDIEFIERYKKKWNIN